MAKNNNLYFQHDYTTINDEKIIYMLSDYGAVGYGLYWRIVELLHSDPLHKIQKKAILIASIGVQMKSLPDFILEFISDCVNKYELFEQENDMIFCPRVNRNISKMEEKSNMAKAAIAKRWNTDVLRTNTDLIPTDTKQKQKLKEKQKENKEKREKDFSLFWQAYGKSSDKSNCLKKFISIEDEDIEKIFMHVPKYVASTPDVQYRKNPLTYLNGKCWNDEPINTTPPKYILTEDDKY